MGKAHRYFIEGDYASALSILKKDAARDSQDDFHGGAICEVGAILICLGRYQEAVSHFKELIESTLYRISMHRSYMGLAYWYWGKKKQAIAQSQG